MRSRRSANKAFTQGGIARALGRDPSTISRELRRNSRRDAAYRPRVPMTSRAGGDPGHGATGSSVRGSGSSWRHVFRKSGARSRSPAGSDETGSCRSATRRSIGTFGRTEGEGGRCISTCGNRQISERPAGAQNRSRVGHLEGDTVVGSSDKHCVLTLVDRKTGYTMIGKLEARPVEAINRWAIELLKTTGPQVRTVTVDNGTEFHGFKKIEAATAARFYFAAPYHSWERGTSENTNGLIRQYLPKRTSTADITQRDCTRIATKLNRPPRKRLGFRTPEECYDQRL